MKMSREEWRARQRQVEKETKAFKALFESAREGNLARLGRQLRGGANPNARWWGRDGLLHWAAWKGELQVAWLLLEAGADPNLKTKHDWTPLHDAIEYNRKEMVALLLSRGADPNAKVKWGNTPLHLAAQYGRTAICDMLLKAGADLHGVDDFNDTVLHEAARNAIPHDAVDLFLDRGLDPDATNDSKETALHSAVEDPNATAGVVKALLEAGASPHLRDDRGRTPLTIAAKEAGPRINRLLKEHVRREKPDRPGAWAESVSPKVGRRSRADRQVDDAEAVDRGR